MNFVNDDANSPNSSDETSFEAMDLIAMKDVPFNISTIAPVEKKKYKICGHILDQEKHRNFTVNIVNLNYLLLT